MTRPQLPQSVQKAIAHLYNDGTPIAQISKNLKCSPGAVRNALKRRGIYRARNPRGVLRYLGIPVPEIIRLQEEFEAASEEEHPDVRMAAWAEARRRFTLTRREAMALVSRLPPYNLGPDIIERLTLAKRLEVTPEHIEDLGAVVEALQEALASDNVAEEIKSLRETIRERLAELATRMGDKDDRARPLLLDE